MSNDRFIVGIDPGYAHCGVAVIKTGDNPTVVKSDSYVVPTKERKVAETRRVGMIVDFVTWVLAPYKGQISYVGLESGIVMPKHGRTTELLAWARGGILYWLDVQGLPVKLFAPAEVKKTITGSGRADKGKVKLVVDMWLRTKTKNDDEADACAIAYCAYLHEKLNDKLRGTM